MFLLRWLAGRWLLRRLWGGAGRRAPVRRSGVFGMGPRYRRQRGGRFGLFGPVPYYSATTRRGARVSVGGCCLPLPLAFTASLLATAKLLHKRH